jgi:hypothetical protein
VGGWSSKFLCADVSPEVGDLDDGMPALQAQDDVRRLYVFVPYVKASREEKRKQDAHARILKHPTHSTPLQPYQNKATINQLPKHPTPTQYTHTFKSRCAAPVACTSAAPSTICRNRPLITSCPPSAVRSWRQNSDGSKSMGGPSALVAEEEEEEEEEEAWAPLLLLPLLARHGSCGL